MYLVHFFKFSKFYYLDLQNKLMLCLKIYNKFVDRESNVGATCWGFQTYMGTPWGVQQQHVVFQIVEPKPSKAH